MELFLIVQSHTWCRGINYFVIRRFALIAMDLRWYSIGVEPSVYQGFGYCLCLLIRCYHCHCKIRKVSIIMRTFSFLSLLGSFLVKSKQRRSNGLLAITDPLLTFGSLYGPLAFLYLLHDFTQLVTSWCIMLQQKCFLMIANVCSLL